MIEDGLIQDALTYLPQGWFHHGRFLLQLIKEHHPNVIVELGSWRGASAIAMAKIARTYGGKVYCVDTWRGSQHGEWGTQAGPPLMINECATHIVNAGVSAHVRLIACQTQIAGQFWTEPPIDLLYVDADHEYASVRADLDAWWPHVREGGIFAGDDYNFKTYPGCTVAWDEFLLEHQQQPRTQFGHHLEDRHERLDLIWGFKTVAAFRPRLVLPSHTEP